MSLMLSEMPTKFKNLYNKRFHKVHACSKHILWLKEHVPETFHSKKSEKAYYSNNGIPECMPAEHWNPDIIEAYRLNYLLNGLKTF